MSADPVEPLRSESSPNSTSAELLRLAQAGDRSAADRLFQRYLPELHRWAHRRMPKYARATMDTADIVHDAAMQTFRHLQTFKSQREHALLRYLRRSLQNRIRDQFRQAARRPMATPLEDYQMDSGESPLALTVEQQNRDRYVAGLKRLRPDERNAIVARLELGYSYEQLALVLQKPGPEAARLAVRRALMRLAREIQHV